MSAVVSESVEIKHFQNAKAFVVQNKKTGESIATFQYGYVTKQFQEQKANQYVIDLTLATMSV